jgi:hypothetical protein
MILINTAGAPLFTTTVVTSGFASGPMGLNFPLPPAISGGGVVLQCLLPAAHPTNGVSVVTTYTINDSL